MSVNTNPSPELKPPPPREIDGKPAIQLPGADRLLGEFANDLGKHLAGAGVYVRGGVAFCATESGNELEDVDPQWLRTWAENHVVCFKSLAGGADSIKRRNSMSLDTARAVVVSQQFLQSMPRLNKLQPCKMPIMREGGTIELLPAGYDAESGTLTNPGGCDYPIDMDVDEARKVIRSALSEFPFKDERSRGVAGAGMFSVFAGGLLPRGSITPCFIYQANAQGAGKTTVALLACAPWGLTEASSGPTDEAEFKKRMLTLCMSGRGVELLDNLKGYLNSPSLEAYLTASSYRDRILGSSKEFSGPADAIFLITSNGLRITPDLGRRSLTCELHMHEYRSSDREFERRLDPPGIKKLQPGLLAAMWAIVKSWDKAGRPKASRDNSNFSQWCDTIGGIVEHAGFDCPTLPTDQDDGGDVDTRDMSRLGGHMKDEKEHTFAEMVALCEENDLFERFTNQKENGELKSAARSGFGKLLGTYHNRYVDTAGERKFKITGKGHSRRYRVVVVGDGRDMF